MSPKTDNQEPSSGPDVTVDISHEQKQTPPAPATAPPLPQLEPLPVRPIKITDNVPPPPPASPDDVPPVSPYEFHEHEQRRWPVILMYTAMAFLVALLVVFAGRWIYRKTTHQTAKTTTTQQGNVPAAPPVNTGPSTSANSNTSPTGNKVPTNGQLPNNGPGDVVAIFVGTALTVSALHYIYSLRRQS